MSLHRPPARMAFVALMPDWGHALPLMKIATAARDAGYEVKCFVPENAAALAKRSGLPYAVIGEAHTAIPEVFKAIGGRSLFFLNFSGYSHTNLFAYPQLYTALTGNLSALRRELDAFAPTVLVADDHLLSDVTSAAADALGATFISHNASGTLARESRPFVRAYGYGDAAPAVMSLVEMAAVLFSAIYRRAFYLRHFGAWRGARAAKLGLMEGVNEVFGTTRKPPAHSITTGLSWIEREFLGTAGAGSGDFPPLPSPEAPLGTELSDWLASSERKVIYVSFGSILTLSDKAYATLAKTLKETGRRVVWSIAVGDIERAKRIIGADPDFYVANFVPQPQLLKRPEIAAMVTHAGAASVLEGLAGGAPILCVPMASDNGYISGLVVRLGAGLRVWKQDLAKPAFRAALARLLDEPSFSANSRAIAERLRGEDAPRAVVAFITQAAKTPAYSA